MNPAVLDPLTPPLGSRDWPAPVAGRVVLVTGAAGSIGREVCARCLARGAARVVLVDLDENGLYLTGRRFEREWDSSRIALEVANVREPSRVRALFTAHAPALVLHAAAHKHVPLLEHAPCEAVRNNVLATSTLCAVARETGADLVLVSTDKAVAPISILGATKRVAEMIAHAQDPPFHVARTGNVLGSAGSVVPLFLEQIAAGGPVTVTHRDATRFFTRVEDAAALVVAAAAPDHGPLLLTDPGKPLAILRLAEALISASGQPVPIEFVGLRPGDKLHESLMSATEAATAVRLTPHLLRVTPGAPPDDLGAALEELATAARAESDQAVRATLAALVPDYVPSAAGGAPATRP